MMENDLMKGKRLAVFGANNVVDEVTAYARQHGIVLVSVGNVPETPIHQVSDEQYYLDCTDEATMLPFFKDKHIDGLLSCSGEMVIRKSVGFIGKTGFRYYATPHQWDVLMNKQHFKDACLRYGMPAIPAFRVEDEDIPFPVIVKPVDNGGSFGVTVCHSRKEMEEAIAKAVQHSTVGEYLCEKFLEGPYFQFEIWRQNGKSYFPYTKGRMFYDAIGQSPRQPFIDLYPSPEADIISQLYDPMSRLFDDLGVSNGSCMFQGIISDGVPYVMDNAFRLSGGMDFRVVHEDKGIDLVACYMQHALTGQFGDDFSQTLTSHLSPLTSQYATLCIGLKNGRIHTIRGIDDVRQLPYVYSLFQYYHEGDTMQYSGIFLQVLCRIFVRANSQQELQQHIHTILGLIEVEGDNGQSLLLDYPHLKIMKQNQAPQPPKGGVTECATTPPSGGRGAYIAIMQPYFFPYIGYWQLINAADMFVVGDSFHYIKDGWIRRNRILGEGGQPQYFGIEVSHASCNRLIYETRRVVNLKRVAKMFRVLESYYSKAPHYSEAMEVIKPILLDEEPDLTRNLVKQLRAVAEYLGIKTEFRLLSEVSERWDCKAPEVIRRTCEYFGMTDYINPSGAGMSYYNKDEFREMGLNLQFLRRNEDICYKQRSAEFVPDLSIIDLMMYCSRDELHDILNRYHFL